MGSNPRLLRQKPHLLTRHIYPTFNNLYYFSNKLFLEWKQIRLHKYQKYVVKQITREIKEYSKQKHKSVKQSVLHTGENQHVYNNCYQAQYISSEKTMLVVWRTERKFHRKNSKIWFATSDILYLGLQHHLFSNNRRPVGAISG